jgi:hypothetical protein
MRSAVFACLVAAVVLAACAAPAPSATTGAAKPEIDFVDLQQFDRDLGASLSATLPRVEVAFYDRIAPSALPPRLQRWLGASDQGGGKLRVVPPPGSVTPRNPLLLISMISSLWSGQKVAAEIAAERSLRVAHNYDVRMLLRQDERGETVVDRIVFEQRPR